MGGMAAQIPIKHDPAANDNAVALVRPNKEREATDGQDGTWVAHPGLVPLAKGVFDQMMPKPNQINKLLFRSPCTKEDLTVIPEGTRTEVGFRHNISVTLGKFYITFIVLHFISIHFQDISIPGFVELDVSHSTT